MNSDKVYAHVADTVGEGGMCSYMFYIPQRSNANCNCNSGSGSASVEALHEMDSHMKEMESKMLQLEVQLQLQTQLQETLDKLQLQQQLTAMQLRVEQLERQLQESEQCCTATQSLEQTVGALQEDVLTVQIQQEEFQANYSQAIKDVLSGTNLFLRNRPFRINELFFFKPVCS